MSLRKYLSDYQTVTTIDDNGREKRSVVYHGPLFEVSLDQEGLTKLRQQSFLLLGLIAVFHIAGGFIDNPGMYQFFISLPYVIAFFPLVYLAAGTLRLPREIRKYRRDEIGHSFNQIKSACRFLLVFQGIGILGEIVLLILQMGNALPGTELIFITLEIASFLFVFLLTRLHNKLIIRMCPEEAQQS